jgi:sugar phosphate isomerase/epimerase
MVAANDRARRARPVGRPLEERIGISQGRLVPSSSGELQCPPGERWREEFASAGSLGLSHIELLAERTVDPANPIWSPQGRGEMVALAASSGIALTSLCTDEPLETPFVEPDVALDLAERLTPVVRDLHVQMVVLPLLETSDLYEIDRSCAARCVAIVAEHLDAPDARIALELGVPAAECLRFLDSVGSPRVGLCYDLGNATARGMDSAAELRMLGPRVWHVHAKDKDARGVNVRFGTGAVRFEPALAALLEHGFDGVLTMASTRGDDPVVTAGEHRAFLLAAASAAAS